MPKINRVVKGDIVKMSVRVSNGFDEGGKRLRKRYSYEVNVNDYPSKEEQEEAFSTYLVSQGEKAILQVEEDTKNSEAKQKKKVSTRTIVSIPLNKIELNEYNPYDINNEFIERLATSIKQDGLNNPIHVILNEKGNYIINKGNKRYLAYRYLQEQEESNIYNEIECYIMQENESNAIDLLKLLRDNVNTNERTIKDKFREVELYSQIVPELKEMGMIEKGIRTREWIAKEMGIADKSVKDYLKVIKIPDIKDKFLSDKVDSLEVALELVRLHKKYGEEVYQELLEGIEKNISAMKEPKIYCHNISSCEWSYERQKRIEEEEREKEEKEKINIDVEKEVIKEEPKQVEEKAVKNLEDLKHCKFAITNQKNIVINYNEKTDIVVLKIDFIDGISKKDMHFRMSKYYGGIEFIVADKNENGWLEYDKYNKLIHLDIEEIEDSFYSLKEFLKLVEFFTNAKDKMFEINDKVNFVEKILPKKYVEKMKENEKG